MTATPGNPEIVTHPTRQPAGDFLTGSVDGPFLDTGVEKRFTPQQGSQRIYLSIATIRFLAERAGILDSPEDRLAHEAAVYNRGKLDAVKEDLGPRLAALGATLTRIADDADVPAGS